MGPINLNASRLMVRGGGLRSLQLIAITMIAAATSFLAIVVASASSAGPAPVAHESTTLLNLLSLLHAVAACLCYWLAGAAYSRRLRARDDEAEPADPETFLERLRAAVVLRLALVEAPSFFGLVICFMAGNRGLLHHEPAYWLNLASAVFFLAFAMRTFPSRSRVEYLLSNIAA
jgi:hypothetical protein